MRITKTAPPHRRNETRDIVNPVLDALNRLPDVVAVRNANLGPVTPLHAPGQVLRAGLGPGSADIVALLAPSGRLLALECKHPGQRPTPEQRAWLSCVRRYGAVAEVIHSVEEALAVVAAARSAR